jgi:hypothetical protein
MEAALKSYKHNLIKESIRVLSVPKMLNQNETLMLVADGT